MLINRFKGLINTIAGVLYFVHVTEKTLDSLSRIVSSVRFKTGSQKEKIEVVALNKTGTLSMLSPRMGRGWGRGGGARRAGIPWGLDSQNSHCPRDFDRRLWHKGGTLSVSARKLTEEIMSKFEGTSPG